MEIAKYLGYFGPVERSQIPSFMFEMTVHISEMTVCMSGITIFRRFKNVIFFIIIQYTVKKINRVNNSTQKLHLFHCH